MNDLNKQSVVSITCATVERIYDIKDIKRRKEIKLQRDAIIEVAAVKIQGKKIEGHFHSFVAIDGYDAREIEFDDFNFNCFKATPNLLIGAPSIKEVIKLLCDYIGDSVVILNGISSVELIKEIAKENGYEFDNAVVFPSDLRDMMRLKRELAENNRIFEETSVLQLAQAVFEEPMDWTNIFSEYNIYFNPAKCEIYEQYGRYDPLSWALAFAQFYINILYDEEDLKETVEANLKPVDDDLPF